MLLNSPHQPLSMLPVVLGISNEILDCSDHANVIKNQAKMIKKYHAYCRYWRTSALNDRQIQWLNELENNLQQLNKRCYHGSHILQGSGNYCLAH